MFSPCPGLNPYHRSFWGFFGASFVFGWYRKHKHFLRISHAKLHSSFCATNRCHIQDQCTFFRTEEVRYRQRDGQAKILGIIFCVLGALLMSIYKGPIIFKRLISKTNPPSSMLPRNNLLMGDLIMGFEGWGIDKWTLGGLCFILQTLSVGIETNLKGAIMARFPAPITVIAGMTLTGFLLMVIICYYTVQEQSEWGFHHVSEFLAAAYGGLIMTGINNVLKCWSVHNRGPIFVASYAPVMPMLSSIFGTFILGESLFLGWYFPSTLICDNLSLDNTCGRQSCIQGSFHVFSSQ
ncbi:hypothetical protein CY35_08G017400 [Sphagnum magellanicum]|nr:hypothetical protein CY35_08G017400 [Sphagnum magellanicum]